tara:strand:- start:72 stop:914 length:843 start_codon:yes stop_codon:yes gene_type:complete
MTAPTNTVSELQKIDPSSIIELYEIHLNQHLHFAQWTPSTAITLGTTISSTTLQFDNSFPPQGMVFECTTAGTTGSSEPTFPTTAGNTVTDNNVVWTAKRPIKRFHSGINQASATAIYDLAIHFDGKVYEPFPIMVEGFAMSAKGSLPRPTLTISNVNPSVQNTWTVAQGGSALPSGIISAMMLEVNKITVGNDLIGSTLVRIRTLAKFLDAENFQGGTNSTADPTQKFPDEIYLVARKTLENQEICQFECASQFDMAGIKAPKRQVLPNEFPGVGEFLN